MTPEPPPIPPPTPSTSTSTSKPAPPFDPLAFQASLDSSIQLTRQLVASWIPKDLGKEWDDENTGGGGNQTLEMLNARSRPARLGLGANPGELHKQLAEERKLRNHLAGPGANKRKLESAIEDDEYRKRKKVEMAKKKREEESSDEEEESRSSAFDGGKGKKVQMNGTGSGPTGVNGAVNGNANGNGNEKKRKLEEDEATTPPITKKLANGHSTSPFSTTNKAPSNGLFDLNTPLLASPAPLQSTPAASPTKPTTNGEPNGSPAAEAGTAATNTTPLTKNQRKKKRQQEKAAAQKLADMAAMRAEEAGGVPIVGSSTTSHDQVATPSVIEGDDLSSPEASTPPLVKTRFPPPPFAPLTSSSESEANILGTNGVNGAESEDDDSDADDSRTGSASASASLNGSFMSVGNFGENSRENSPGKKKRRKRNKKKKKKKGGGGEGGGGEPAPILNLGPTE